MIQKFRTSPLFSPLNIMINLILLGMLFFLGWVIVWVPIYLKIIFGLVIIMPLVFLIELNTSVLIFHSDKIECKSWISKQCIKASEIQFLGCTQRIRKYSSVIIPYSEFKNQANTFGSSLAIVISKQVNPTKAEPAKYKDTISFNYNEDIWRALENTFEKYIDKT